MSLPPFERVCYVSAKGSVAEAYFVAGCGRVVQRTELSAVLLECAETLPNLEIQEGVPVACSLEGNPEVSIKNNVFHPKLLIVADGLHSRVRKLANLEATIPKLKRWVFDNILILNPGARLLKLTGVQGLKRI